MDMISKQIHKSCDGFCSTYNKTRGWDPVLVHSSQILCDSVRTGIERGLKNYYDVLTLHDCYLAVIRTAWKNLFRTRCRKSNGQNLPNCLRSWNSVKSLRPWKKQKMILQCGNWQYNHHTWQNTALYQFGNNFTVGQGGNFTMSYFFWGEDTASHV